MDKAKREFISNTVGDFLKYKAKCTEDFFNDPVNNPKHYNSHPSGIECIEITEHMNFCVGNAIKYLWRAGLKSDADLNQISKTIEDLEKAIFYIEREISRISSHDND